MRSYGAMAWLLLHVDAIGFGAALLTSIAFVPQVVRSWRAGGEELSVAMLTLFGTGVGLWFLIGYLRRSGPLMAANGAPELQVLGLFALKFRSRRRPRHVRAKTQADVRI